MRKLLIVISIFLLAGTTQAEVSIVKQGDTLSNLLQDSYTYDEITALAREIKNIHPGFVLRTGMSYEKDGHSLSLAVSTTQEIRVHREEELPRVTLLNYNYEVMPTIISGTINSTLFAAIYEIGEDSELAARLARIYEWEFDFFRDIHPGDSFTVLVEKRFIRGRYIGYGHILAADFVVRGRHHKAFYFTQDGKSGYFNQDARALERGFLRVPLSYSRISSRFTDARLHPVTKEVKPHYGVDYAAPQGTPVMATASGTVTKREYNKLNGNYIELRHANNYYTYYIHLSGFHKSLSLGAKVSQGDVIGYVGSTGLSTGPHLDYRIKHNGNWLNPLTFVAESPKLEEDSVAEFMEIAAKYNGTIELKNRYAGRFKPTHIP